MGWRANPDCSSRAALVPTRKTLPRSAFLPRRHPVGAGDRFGRRQSHLADISADGFAGNGRLGALAREESAMTGLALTTKSSISKYDFIRPSRLVLRP